LTVRIQDFPDEQTVPRLLVRPLERSAVPRLIRVSWYGPPVAPRYGECWRLTVRLRRPRGFSNPSRFDYERWLFEQRIGATGYVRNGQRLDACPAPGLTMRLRTHLHDRLVSLLPDDGARAVMLAVTLGARQWLTDTQWQAFSVTGTSHLMAISGLHVALVAGLCFGVARGGLAVAGLPINHNVAAGAFALVAAMLYCAISGFAIPARRAVLMLGFGIVALLWRRPLDPWQTTGLAAALILLMSPLDGMTIGFRLSFLAVILLLCFAARSPARPDSRVGLAGRLLHRFGELGALQCGLFFGMLPLVVTFFGRVAWVSPVTNLIVVPLFNLASLPATLLGAGLETGFGDWLLLCGWRGANYTLAIIDLAANLPHAAVQTPRLSPAMSLVLGAAALFALLPVAWPGRGIAVLSLVSVLIYRPPATPPDCVDVDVLDVGQGLAALVRTSTHSMLYDAGPAFRSGSDTGQLVVAPFLRASGVDRLDLLVVSHGDNDHAGGVDSVLRSVPTQAVLHGEAAGVPATGPSGHTPVDRDGTASPPSMACVRGQTWSFDGVRFTVLHPGSSRVTESNNASCVIEIRVGERSILLTGDIEAIAERELVHDGLVSPADVVLVPHHGSNTSSLPLFVAAVSPATAIVSAGYANQWGMPKPDVVRRWTDSGATVLNTAESGAIQLRRCADSDRDQTIQQRKDRRRFWHER
ncbi:MAG: DNA internalization-related competence protein ComEC/Rec2, partial [Pseudomonadota bacterium]